MMYRETPFTRTTAGGFIGNKPTRQVPTHMIQMRTQTALE